MTPEQIEKGFSQLHELMTDAVMKLEKIREGFISEHKPESVRFVEGDFGQGILSRHNAFCVTGQGEKKFDEWISAFEFLAFHCLKLGGVVGAKDEDGASYCIMRIEYDWTIDSYAYASTRSFFWFPKRSQAEAFLNTPNVKENLDRFYMIGE